MDLVKASKQLSYVLRHRPDSIGITLAVDGWVDIDVLLNALAANGTRLSKEDLARVVAENDKQRFAIEGERIRASQGHSVEVELGYVVATPPDVLYHGTAERNLASIFDKGLVRGRRHHVHLSAEAETALKVGARHGRPVVLTVDAAKMLSGGYQFHVSENGVWLTETVPAEFLAGHNGRHP